VKYRIPQSDDQKNAERAMEILKDLPIKFPDIETKIWILAFWTCIMQSFINSKMSFNELKKEIYVMMEFYKDKFEE
jgi:hypothetical protein